MVALLVFVALLAPRPTLWPERRGDAVHVVADLTAFFDAALERRLKSGLTTRLRLTIQLRSMADAVFLGAAFRNARARWDLWEERLTVIIDDADGARTLTFTSIDAFTQAFGKLDTPVAYGLLSDATVMQLSGRMEVNPLSAEEASKARRWLASPTASSALDPLSSGLLGSFVRLFDNLKPGVAERVLEHAGQPFRADRIPYPSKRSQGDVHGSP